MGTVLARMRLAFSHNAWANRQAVESVLRAVSPPPRVADVAAHVLGAECEWLRRLGQSAPNLAVWPALAPSDCVPFLLPVADAWRTLLDGTDDDGLERSVPYTNSKGEQWSSTVADVLTHVTLHSAYHRGQIATLLGRAGHAVAYTDYIEFIRRGYAGGNRSV